MENQRVECLGMTFADDDERRVHFLEKLKEKLADPEFRKTPGFPKGSDDAILRMSDPPFYTACPNPFLGDFVRLNGKPHVNGDADRREPFTVDTSVGKTDALYKAHSYHTKVPHLAIVPSILHYTEPGDVVLDGFCGSGMTGVAAQLCGSAAAEDRAAPGPVEEGGAREAQVGRSPRRAQRPRAGRNVHRRQLQSPLRCRCLRVICSAHP